jgi:hypothetical protein
MLDDRHHGYPVMGHIELQIYQKTSPFYALLLNILPSSYYCNHILSALVLLLVMSCP